MFFYYIVNILEIFFGIFFLIAAFKFFTTKTEAISYKCLGLAFLVISILSFTVLGLSVQESGIV
ncbi:hypothetical protein [Virgibacillus halodenitrificans]|uniref:hypothetical protein n=1 Tax=Virgibacillus halodenitrificans TaxID=1482 RepID=UPI000EF52709|nr:hypothetical protein [Virgibacillus halodenitrificans]